MKSLSISTVALTLSLNSLAQSQETTILERGPHQQTVQTVRQFVDDLGQTVTETNTFVQLTPGLHWFDRRTQGWEETKEEFEIAPNGRAVARRGQHQVVLSPNITTRGAVDLTTSDDKHFQSRVFGISYFDPITGQSVLIAEVKDSIGELVAPNQVIYPDAFTDFHADLRMTYTKSGFEQDVILRERPPSPEQWGIDPARAQLQVMTEFIDPPVPLDRVGSTNTEPNRFFIAPNLTDERLDFGAVMIGQGKAFGLDDADGPSPIDLADDKAVPVGKNWSQLDGRDFLIESVNYATIAPALERLPAAPQASVDRPKRKTGRLAELIRERPQRVAMLRPDSKESILVAKAGQTGRKGFVIDYVILTTIANHTFKADATYYLTNTATLSGVSIIEGGTVVKYTNSGQIKFQGTVKCQTSAYRPAVFTSKDDNSLGEPILGSTGNPSTNYPASTALYFDNNQSDLKYIRVAHADQAIYYDSDTGYPHYLSHAQIVHCRKGILPHNTAFYVRNVLMHDVLTNFYNTTYNATGYVHHLTANTAAYLNGSSSLITLNVTNSLLVAVNNIGTISGSFNATNSSASGVFQAVGAGNHYLVSGSSYRDAGSTNICDVLKADLATMTTYPPIVLTNTYTTSLVLSPQAQRDTDTPDIGYHYFPIDYAVNTLIMTNATLTLTNGVALATFGNNGIWLQDGSQLFSEGTPINRNHLARFFNVQEQSTNWGGGTLSGMATINPYNNGVSPPIAQLRFTDFDGLCGSGYQILTSSTTNWVFSSLLLQDCSFNSGVVNLEGPTNSSFSLTNNLFERVALGAQYASQIAAYNNLVRFGTISTLNTGTNNWTFKDNAFDSTSIADFGNALTASNNAYIGMGADRFYPTSTNDVVLTGFTYGTGPLGPYYHVSTNLLNVGSRNATNAGLYHHTVLLDQTKETNSTVDIGFHYVAVNPAESEVPKTPSYMVPTASSSYDANWSVDKSTNGLTADYGWHNQASGWNEEPAYLRIDLLSSKSVSRIGYIGRVGGGNGVYRNYRIYVTDSSSTNAVDWGTEVAAGEWLWPNGQERRDVEFCPKSGRYVIFRRITSDGYHGLSGTDPGYANANEVWIYTRNSLFSSALDYDGDGLPDYFEDHNGNGSVNSGETDWQSGSDLGLKVWITEPKSNSNLP